jgi:hypothetical protein
MVAFLAAVPAVAFLPAGPLRQVQREGVERHVLLRSASAAFFATMAAALAYGCWRPSPAWRRSLPGGATGWG